LKIRPHQIWKAAGYDPLVRTGPACVELCRSVYYLHSAPAAEPLLWLPDVIAWAYGRGGDWIRRASDVITDVRDVGP
jgi:hypothetical protein